MRIKSIHALNLINRFIILFFYSVKNLKKPIYDKVHNAYLNPTPSIFDFIFCVFYFLERFSVEKKQTKKNW